MGGTIGFTIREKSGKEHRMFRWTNAFPNFFNDIKFIEQDEQHLKKYLRVWYDMVKAYESGDTSELPMADVYVPGAGLYPSEYGLIVVDYASNTVLSLQEYSAIGEMNTFHFSNVIDGRPKDEDSEREAQRIMRLFEAGRMIRMNTPDNRKSIDIRGFSMEQLAKVYAYVVLDMSPWKIINFDFDRKGFNTLKEAIKGLGFEFSEEEEKGWTEFFEWRFD